MNLVVDIGNTRIKYAVFSKRELLEQHIAKNTKTFDLSSFVKEKGIHRSIVSSVITSLPGFVNALREQTDLIEFSSETKIPVKNLYQTANTLGNDRIPSVLAARAKHPNKNILVIDAGTCIKYNFITAAGEYLGGGISPGIEMRLKALNAFTDRLPLVSPDFEFKKLVGNSTNESILSGVMTGTLAEVEGILNRYKQQYPSLVTVVTGGNSGFFEKAFKNSIFAEPDLVLKGLNIILEYNAAHPE